MSLLIDPRYCGPPDSANGGYFAGLAAQSLPGPAAQALPGPAAQSLPGPAAQALPGPAAQALPGPTAQALPGPAEVTLRLPPPLGRPMALRREHEGIDVLDGGRVVAEVRTAVPDLDHAMPDPVSLAQAEHASHSYLFAAGGHPFPTCFVCGTQRAPGDGLRLFPGPVGDVVACAWTPHESLAGDDGAVRPEFLWAALDCPSFFGAVASGHAETAAAVLGRITAQVWQRPDVGGPLVVQAWGESGQGRRSVAGSAVFTADGRLCAAARAVWIRLGRP